MFRFSLCGRAPALACLGALALGFPLPLRVADAPPPPPLYPLILVPGYSAAAEAFGLPELGRRPGPFYAALVRRGYVPGRTLFWVDHPAGSGAGFEQLARQGLGPLVDKVLRETGAPRVDIIAQGAGALAARYYIHALAGAARVRTLVMLSPPNRGSYLATLYKAAGTMAEQVERRRASGRGLGRVLVAGAALAPFSGEAEYVDRVAFEYFEPLYDQFLAEGVFLRRPAGRSRPEAFPDWIARRYPSDFLAAFPAAQRPPLLEQPAGSREPRGTTPAAGAGAVLTRCYFNLLALEVARNNYRLLAPWLQVAAQGWQGDLKWQGNWKATLRAFVRKRAERLWNQWLERVAAALGQELVVAGGRQLSGLEPSSPAVNSLVSEVIALRAGETGDLLANFALAELNSREAGRADPAHAADGVRYVTVAAALPRGWTALLAPDLAADLEREAGSAFLPPGPLDAFLVGGGLRALLPGGLLRRGDVVRRVIDYLDPVGPVARWHRPHEPSSPAAPGTMDGEGRASLAEPAVFGLDLRGLAAAGAVEAEVRPLARPSGLGFAAFLAVSREGRLRHLRPLAASGPEAGVLQGRLDLGGIDPVRDRAFLVVRLLPEGGAVSPAFAAIGFDPQTSSWAPHVAFTYRIAVCPGGPCSGAGGSAARADGPERSGAGAQPGAAPVDVGAEPVGGGAEPMGDSAGGRSRPRNTARPRPARDRARGASGLRAGTPRRSR